MRLQGYDTFIGDLIDRGGEVLQQLKLSVRGQEGQQQAGSESGAQVIGELKHEMQVRHHNTSGFVSTGPWFIV